MHDGETVDDAGGFAERHGRYRAESHCGPGADGDIGRRRCCALHGHVVDGDPKAERHAGHVVEEVRVDTGDGHVERFALASRNRREQRDRRRARGHKECVWQREYLRARRDGERAMTKRRHRIDQCADCQARRAGWLDRLHDDAWPEVHGGRAVPHRGLAEDGQSDIRLLRSAAWARRQDERCAGLDHECVRQRRHFAARRG